MSIEIQPGDVVVRDAAVTNLRNIAGKVDTLRVQLAEQEFVLSERVLYEQMNESDYHQEVARLRGELIYTLGKLLHGLATTFTVSAGGSVTPEDETSLIGLGYLHVGLIDHGESWSVHS